MALFEKILFFLAAKLGFRLLAGCAARCQPGTLLQGKCLFQGNSRWGPVRVRRGQEDRLEACA